MRQQSINEEKIAFLETKIALLETRLATMETLYYTSLRIQPGQNDYGIFDWLTSEEDNSDDDMNVVPVPQLDLGQYANTPADEMEHFLRDNWDLNHGITNLELLDDPIEDPDTTDEEPMDEDSLSDCDPIAWASDLLY